ncbi:MAG: reverse transcriptase/maturase family protein [bacterium]|nr:reverse transcriptase/maturase family protein [bacterium]
MKRYGALYSSVTSFENLIIAAYRARRGKRARPDVAAFHFDLEHNILTLQQELIQRTYQPAGYRSFYIRDPKRRLISAAPYRDRIVHHALCQVIAPIFESTFIDDSYANRIGKGAHRALDRCTYFCRRYRFVLKCDIEKYFPTIDHAILLQQIRRKIKCQFTLWLIEEIIAHSNEQEEIIRYFPGDNLFTPLERRRGIPIGNLTSQFFANIYLNGFDHFVKQEVKPAGYVRFVDDFLLFADDKDFFRRKQRLLQEYLNCLRLNLHARKRQIYQVKCGVPFLGWQVFPGYRRLRRSTGVRIQRRLRILQQSYATGDKSLNDIRSSVMSWIGHLRHGDTWGLRRKLLGSCVFKKNKLRDAEKLT